MRQNPYNISMKAQFMRRAKESIRPYDQMRFSNKMGQAARPDHGYWIPSTGRAQKRNKNRKSPRVGPGAYYSRGNYRNPPSLVAEHPDSYNGYIDGGLNSISMQK